MSYKTVPCRSCQAAMIWAISPAGRQLPLDARPTAEMYNGGANPPRTTYRIVEEGDHRNPRLLAVDAAGSISDETYVSHFATCPNASQHTRMSQ